MTGHPAGQALLEIAAKRTSPEALEWLKRGLPEPGGELDRPTFFGRFAGVTRRVGANKAPWTEAEAAALRELGVLDPSVWSLGDVTRAGLLLVALAVLPADAHVPFATEIFRRGETAERVGLLRSLCLLPDAPRFKELAAEACRSHVQDVLEALFCENAFVAAHSDELAFNQVIMKAMFVGIPLARIPGWESRVNAELLRMSQDFAAERRAAGRPVPDDVVRIADVAQRGVAARN